MRVGLTVYDLLAFDRRWLADPDQRVDGRLIDGEGSSSMEAKKAEGYF